MRLYKFFYLIFKTLDSISGDDLRKIKGVKGNKMFDVYIFDKKI